MSIPIVTIDFCSEPVDLHCPVCGRLVFALGVQQQGCPHLLFLADSVTNDWLWQHEKYVRKFDLILQQKFAEAEKSGFYGSQVDYLATIRADKCAAIAAEMITRKAAFMFIISTSDIGCGGMYNGTIYALFDYQAGS